MARLLKLIPIFVLFAVSCKKKHEASMGGITKEAEAGSIMPFVKIRLMEGDEYGKNSRAIDSTTSDANGKFNITFTPSKQKKYALNFVDECFTYTSGFNSKKAGNYYDQYFISGTGHLTVLVRNKNPYNNNDRFSYSFNKNAVSGDYPALVGSSVACYIQGCYVKLNTKIYIKSFITKNNIITVKLDSVIATTCDDLTIGVDY
jgi:hypothetical protein